LRELLRELVRQRVKELDRAIGGSIDSSNPMHERAFDAVFGDLIMTYGYGAVLRALLENIVEDTDRLIDDMEREVRALGAWGAEAELFRVRQLNENLKAFLRRMT
jgi:hypothetical protein